MACNPANVITVLTLAETEFDGFLRKPAKKVLKKSIKSYILLALFLFKNWRGRL